MGTWRLGYILSMNLLPKNALSRANDQVSREAVCCAPFKANMTAKSSRHRNSVATASEAVA